MTGRDCEHITTDEDGDEFACDEPVGHQGRHRGLCTTVDGKPLSAWTDDSDPVAVQSDADEHACVAGISRHDGGLLVEFFVPGVADVGASIADLTPQVRAGVRAALDAQEPPKVRWTSAAKQDAAVRQAAVKASGLTRRRDARTGDYTLERDGQAVAHVRSETDGATAVLIWEWTLADGVAPDAERRSGSEPTLGDAVVQVTRALDGTGVEER